MRTLLSIQCHLLWSKELWIIIATMATTRMLHKKNKSSCLFYYTISNMSKSTMYINFVPWVCNRSMAVYHSVSLCVIVCQSMCHICGRLIACVIILVNVSYLWQANCLCNHPSQCVISMAG